MARMKLAIGPAATIAARWGTGLKKKVAGAPRLRHLADGVGVRHARGVLVAEELHVAAERNRRDLPARAVAIVKAEQLGPKSDREGEHAHAAPSRDQKVPELVKENDDRQNEQERNDVAGKPAAPRADMSKERFHLQPQFPTELKINLHESCLKCLCGDFGQEVA